MENDLLCIQIVLFHLLFQLSEHPLAPACSNEWLILHIQKIYLTIKLVYTNVVIHSNVQRSKDNIILLVYVHIYWKAIKYWERWWPG